MMQDAITAQAEVAKLRFQLARYRRAEFGRSSEKLEREAEQLELAIEALETDRAERMAIASPFVAAAIEGAIEARKPARRPLPEHLPREEMTHPAPCACPRSRRGGAPCPYRRIDVRRSSAALPPGRDLRARGREPGALDLVRLG